jgi:hypothetical protein
MKQPPIEVEAIAPLPSSSVQILVRGAYDGNNRIMTLNVDPREESVGDVMAMIQDKQGRPNKMPRLTYAGKLMESGRPLHDNNIQKESTLLMANYSSNVLQGRLNSNDVHFERLPFENEVSVNVRLPTGQMEGVIVHEATTVARLMRALTAPDSTNAMRALADACSTMEEACDALQNAMDTLVEQGARCVYRPSSSL